jgi:hypothetical protein
VRCFNVESASELSRIEAVARSAGKQAPISIHTVASRKLSLNLLWQQIQRAVFDFCKKIPSVFLIQVTSLNKFNSYEIFYDRTRKM